MYSKFVSTLLGRSRQKDKDTVGSAHSAAALCDKCGHASRSPSISTANLSSHDCDDMRHRDFVLKWNLKYVGSFPISNTSADHVAQRLERFNSSQATPVTFAVSLLGVRVHGDDDLILSHPLKRVCSVVGRPSERQIAYIALEATGQTYRRQCHVFRTQHPQDVEEIESVLGNAFQAALAARQNMKSAAVLTATSTPAATISEKRASSSAFLSRLIGKSREFEDPKTMTKRKRRPVSAVFSAFQRFSSSANVSQKRMTSFEPFCRSDVPTRSSPVPEEPVPPKAQSPPSTGKENRLSFKPTEPPLLVFDEKLGEMICPIDEGVEAQLENVNYFVKLPSREQLVKNLLSRPEGAFVVRYSESKRKCLALSVRVPMSHHQSGISHYLIIRNENGYRIRHFSRTFPSLQMLVTHYSVLQEQLPVSLYFVDWNKSDWQQMPQQYHQRISMMNDMCSTPKRRSRHSRLLLDD